MFKFNKKTLISTLIVSLLFTACGDDKPTKNYDGEKLLKEKCSSCHNLNMPPVVSDDELAPPMMAVSFHVNSFVKPTDESQRISKAIEFVVDYIFEPSFEKSFCDKESLTRYGLMPSQKEKLNKDEAKAVATYMFEHFTMKNLNQKQKEQAEYDSKPEGMKIALKYRCLGCHRIDKKIVGPSFNKIAKKYKNSPNIIQNSIKNGSVGKWESSKGAMMPKFKKVTDNELKILSNWILNVKNN